MADDMTAVVQRMIDAGESEENIATVIQHYKSSSPTGPSSSPLTPRAGENDLTRQLLGPGRTFPGTKPLSDDPNEDPGIVSHLVNPSPGMRLAGDVAAFALPILGPSATIRAGSAIAKHAPRLIKAGIAKLPVDAVDADLVSIASPRGGAALRKLQQVKSVLSTSDAPASAPTSVSDATPVDLSAAVAEARAAKSARFGSERSWAAQLAQNPDGWRVDASGLTPEQTAAQAAVHHAPVAPEASIPVSGPQGVPASAQVPSSFAALLRPPSPAQLANAEALVARGRSLADAARTVSRGDAELGARIMTALQAGHK